MGGAVSDDIIQPAAPVLVEAAAPARMVMFGSSARGDAKEDSDADFLVPPRGPSPGWRARSRSKPRAWFGCACAASQRTTRGMARRERKGLTHPEHGGRVARGAAAATVTPTQDVGDAVKVGDPEGQRHVLMGPQALGDIAHQAHGDKPRSQAGMVDSVPGPGNTGLGSAEA